MGGDSLSIVQILASHQLLRPCKHRNKACIQFKRVFLTDYTIDLQ